MTYLQKVMEFQYIYEEYHVKVDIFEKKNKKP